MNVSQSLTLLPQRRLVMGNRHQRLDAVFMALVKEVVVELQPFLVRLRVVAVREDTAPGDGGAEHLEAHLREELDVLFIVMVEINGLEFQIVRRRLGRRGTLDAMRHDVLDIETLAVLIVRTLALVGRHCATPQKILRKVHYKSPFAKAEAHL